jgi:hypothetical protein
MDWYDIFCVHYHIFVSIQALFYSRPFIGFTFDENKEALL